MDEHALRIICSIRRDGLLESAVGSRLYLVASVLQWPR